MSVRAPTATARKLRVLVVDDHDVVQWGFRVLLGEQPWVERCLSARTSEEALAVTASLRPDVALVALFLPANRGRISASRFGPRRRAPASCSSPGRPDVRPAARAAGASGFVSKDWDADAVIAAVRRVGLGMTMLEPKASSSFCSERSAPARRSQRRRWEDPDHVEASADLY